MSSRMSSRMSSNKIISEIQFLPFHENKFILPYKDNKLTEKEIKEKQDKFKIRYPWITKHSEIMFAIANPEEASEQSYYYHDKYPETRGEYLKLMEEDRKRREKLNATGLVRKSMSMSHKGGSCLKKSKKNISSLRKNKKTNKTKKPKNRK